MAGMKKNCIDKAGLLAVVWFAYVGYIEASVLN